jgi:hypothetical protein
MNFVTLDQELGRSGKYKGQEQFSQASPWNPAFVIIKPQ